VTGGHELARAAMVERQLRRRGIEDERVLAAMGSVPRELFVAAGDADRAYQDAALGIDCGQTISQPWIVAAIAQALELEGDERLLEIGTGSGYSTAVLARLAAEVVSIERIAELAEQARRNLSGLGVEAEVLCADGSSEIPGEEGFDAIAVHAALPGAPRTLLGRLRPGGRLVAPIAVDGYEELTVFRRGENGEGWRRRSLGPCRFVPLIGEEGYRAD
jgi:protein-L-isoaspartate(D-aspartate) O-methyltransferase